MKHILIFSLLAFSMNTMADDCQSSFYSLGKSLPGLKLPTTGITFDNAVKADFCFDPKAGKEYVKEFEALKAVHIFGENNCADPEKLSADEQIKLTRFMMKVMEEKPLNLYSLTPPGVVDENYAPKKLVFSNVQTDKTVFNFKDANRLTGTDVFKIGGVIVGSSLVGTVMSRQIYKGSEFADKRKHEMAGALINLAGSGVAYVAIETMGLGNKLNLSKHARKCAVTATGSLMLFVAAAGKEAYDKTKPKKHTVDANDFVATVLGGGAGAPFIVSCGFDF
ncbi:hypothetical protein DOM21_07790 [Bacteriovorax stolpii]|uniref:Uncharacterized protein n=1 Tax=Bacteriovorax stolpii TaxID=960 RepID=A0A2K9NT10_BACTC|nr:hypothetical protein [Bacteriovorax stolpii]AUN98663.1 hypothetical protein C0V70_11230 [Bacteriovorax stolpii]QDK41357.1 hypothetical protein DOM21_07790 [Bacteriovorax stolpii]TDP55829.1 hypothetical protein C8D79_0886 [Bacteriovorax stolpii]